MTRASWLLVSVTVLLTLSLAVGWAGSSSDNPENAKEDISPTPVVAGEPKTDTIEECLQNCTPEVFRSRYESEKDKLPPERMYALMRSTRGVQNFLSVATEEDLNAFVDWANADCEKGKRNVDFTHAVLGRANKEWRYRALSKLVRPDYWLDKKYCVDESKSSTSEGTITINSLVSNYVTSWVLISPGDARKDAIDLCSSHPRNYQCPCSVFDDALFLFEFPRPSGRVGFTRDVNQASAVFAKYISRADNLIYRKLPPALEPFAARAIFSGPDDNPDLMRKRLIYSVLAHPQSMLDWTESFLGGYAVMKKEIDSATFDVLDLAPYALNAINCQRVKSVCSNIHPPQEGYELMEAEYRSRGEKSDAEAKKRFYSLADRIHDAEMELDDLTVSAKGNRESCIAYFETRYKKITGVDIEYSDEQISLNPRNKNEMRVDSFVFRSLVVGLSVIGLA